MSSAEQVAYTTGAVCAKHFQTGLRAVILTGSIARGEGSVIECDGLSRFTSDAEFIVILRDGVIIPTAKEMDHLRRQIEIDLAIKNIECQISLSAAHVQFLRDMKAHIFAFETRACGRVVYGESTILESIPPFIQSDIPREDAWRLLSNRMIEMAETIASTPENTVTTAPLVYRMVKLYLDMTTSLLLFFNRYAPTYRERSERLAELAANGDVAGSVPFPLGPFLDAVNACTRAKLAGQLVTGELADWKSVSAACQFALQLWKWELQELTGAKNVDSPKALCLLSMKRQPVAARLRGWAYAVRRRGWHRSLGQWLRWTKLAYRASPRYWLYACIGEVFLRQDTLLFAAIPPASELSDWNSLWSCLPMLPSSSSPSTGQREALLQAIAWNYHEFLEETRA